MAELAHYFGVRPWEVDQLAYAEIEVLLDRLRKLPPVGAVFLVEMKG